VVVLFAMTGENHLGLKLKKTAIRNKGFELGYDFVTFIPLDKPINIPAWLPKTDCG